MGTLESSYPRMAAPSRRVVFGCLPVQSILKFVSCKYCPFLLKIIFSYLIFLVAVVSAFFLPLALLAGFLSV